MVFALFTWLRVSDLDRPVLGEANLVAEARILVGLPVERYLPAGTAGPLSSPATQESERTNDRFNRGYISGLTKNEVVDVSLGSWKIPNKRISSMKTANREPGAMILFTFFA
jgi:hypothetical protein